MEQHLLVAGGRSLAATAWGRIDSEAPVIVMMHGGLDCTSTWKDLPEAIARASGLAVLSYDRWGYGGSEAYVGRRERSYRFEESGPVFAEVLRHFGIRHSVVFGHSDGGAMGLLAAAAHPDAVRGVCACSPTVALDLPMVRAMASARQAFEHGGLREKLVRHHGDKTDAMFWAWYEPWADEAAVAWSMAKQVAEVRCPVAALFGQDDDYGWRASARLLVDHGRMPLELTAIPAVGHDPQHRARAQVLAALARVASAAGIAIER
ncbi:alpha/beta fold hydrolase [Piscinibacter koreensis]|jgi:pimeloyl-ACP methyl ester carboxylesterase|uniref:Alpha/beta hydrolase n=1 Tax=Piscinibacter koreensis TaxID=2742824 RepID=A0A7Y6NQM9_9BURK|nr:alpha/beta hydrolase [Schlegelella koreensis]NUZ07545.1 alpha/beta hydrolase [Schlegelella koreensis]